MSLIYTYVPGQIDTFVALQPTLKGIFPKPPHIIWIMEEGKNQQLQKVKQHKIFLNQVSNCQEAIEKYHELHRKGDQFLICCSDVSVLLDLNQCKSFLDEEEVKIVVFYPVQQTKDNLATFFELKPDLHPKFMMATDDIHELVHLTNQKLKTLSFVFLSDPDQTKIALFGLEGMVYQPTDRKKIVEHFGRICTQNKCSSTDVKEFIQFYEDWQYSPPGNLVLKQYQKEKFFYKVFNRILRCNQHPFEIYYIQPFVADLFNHIRSCYNQKHQKKLTCYRGAYLSKEEMEKIKSKGPNQIVQSLGFMSTSMIPKIALQFAFNTLIIIEVENDKRQQLYDYGYIQCQELKQMKEERQILFNVLSSFTIVGWKENAKWQKEHEGSNKWVTLFEVHLKYGTIPKIMAKNPSQRSQKEEIICVVRQLQFVHCFMFSNQLSALSKCLNPLAVQHIKNYLEFEASLRQSAQKNINISSQFQLTSAFILYRCYLVRNSFLGLWRATFIIFKQDKLSEFSQSIERIFQLSTYVSSCKNLKQLILKQKSNLFLDFCKKIQSNLESAEEKSSPSIFFRTIISNRKFQDLFSYRRDKKQTNILSFETMIRLLLAVNECLIIMASSYFRLEDQKFKDQKFESQLKNQYITISNNLIKRNPVAHWARQVFIMFGQIVIQVQQKQIEKAKSINFDKIIKIASISQFQKYLKPHLEAYTQYLKIYNLMLEKKHNKSIKIPNVNSGRLDSASLHLKLMQAAFQLSEMKNLKAQISRVNQIQKQVIETIELFLSMYGKKQSSVDVGIQILRKIYAQTGQTQKLRDLNRRCLGKDHPFLKVLEKFYE